MNLLLLVVSLAALGIGLFTAVWYVFVDRAPRLLATRLAQYPSLDGDLDGPLGPPGSSGTAPRGAVVPRTERERRMGRSLFQRVVTPTFTRIADGLARNVGPQKLESLQVQLDSAGGMWGLSPQGYLAVQFAAVVGGAAIGVAIALLLAAEGIMIAAGAIFFGLVGFLVPRMKLQRAVKARQVAVLDGMPNALDLLTISVEAGLSFDAAMLRVAEKYHNALSEHLNQVLTEMKLGRPRREALRAMAERVGLDDLTTFVQAVVQSEQIGTGLSGVLRIQADEMRRKRRQRAEEAGAKAPLKMLLPMVGCIFPTLFIVLLGPAVLDVLHQFSGSSQ